ncbi:MAG: type II toxin-antitoxin system HipA family toxin, partial [Cytophagales bacterium]
PDLAQGKMSLQFAKLSECAGITEKTFNDVMVLMQSQSNKVEKMIDASFLNESTKKNYWQAYQGKLKHLMKT